MFQRVHRHGQKAKIAEFYGLVEPGLILATRCFKDVNRPLKYGDDLGAQDKVYVYSWRPTRNFVWVGSPWSGDIQPVNPPIDRVFVALVCRFGDGGEDVFGTIETWNWLPADSGDRDAPERWAERYVEKLW